ncbi:MAG: AAA family ATPase [Bacteroidales bacterium]|nr:AAA family ATPase [Bacteroidales bacterium]
MAEQAGYKRIPYCVSDFRQLMEERKYYVDKTMNLPCMEEVGNFLFCIRPRRFGKRYAASVTAPRSTASWPSSAAASSPALSRPSPRSCDPGTRS